jgi:hypothetical protein
MDFKGFNLTSGSGSASQSSSGSSGSAPAHRGSLLSTSSQMMAGMSQGVSQGSKTMSLGLGSLTKSVTGAVSSLPSLSTVSGTGSSESTVSSSFSYIGGKKKLTPEERQAQQIATVVGLLEDVRLQSPGTHTGFVVAFSTATVSPVNNPYVKFRWFKMNSLMPDKFHQVDESSRAWYPPTADDIGCKICLQCEDKLGQGLSRYIEVRKRFAMIANYVRVCACIVYCYRGGSDSKFHRGVRVGAGVLRSERHRG